MFKVIQLINNIIRILVRHWQSDCKIYAAYFSPIPSAASGHTFKGRSHMIWKAFSSIHNSTITYINKNWVFQSLSSISLKRDHFSLWWQKKAMTQKDERASSQKCGEAEGHFWTMFWTHTQKDIILECNMKVKYLGYWPPTISLIHRINPCVVHNLVHKSHILTG